MNEFGHSDVARDAAASASQASLPPKQVHLSNGVILNIRQVAPLLIRRAAANVPKPKIPVVWLEEKGREEPNPYHPDYLAAMAEYQELVSEAGLNAMLLTGTSPASLPDGMSGPDDNGWTEELEALDIAIPTSKPGRYLAWLQFVALKSLADFYSVGEAVGKASGLSEEDVQTAIESFRSDQGRGTDNGSADPVSPINGDQLQTASSRNGARD